MSTAMTKPPRPRLTLKAQPPQQTIKPQMPTPPGAPQLSPAEQRARAAARAAARAEREAAIETAKPKPRTPQEQAEHEARAAANIARQKAEHIAAKIRRAARNKALKAQLMNDFPFVFDPAHPKPLAIGIDHEIAAAMGIKRHHLGPVLTRWIDHPAYRRALAAGGMRYHLDGSDAGPISDDHRAFAQELLAAKA